MLREGTEVGLGGISGGGAAAAAAAATMVVAAQHTQRYKLLVLDRHRCLGKGIEDVSMEMRRMGGCLSIKEAAAAFASFKLMQDCNRKEEKKFGMQEKRVGFWMNIFFGGKLHTFLCNKVTKNVI